MKNTYKNSILLTKNTHKTHNKGLLSRILGLFKHKSSKNSTITMGNDSIVVIGSNNKITKNKEWK